MTNRATITFTQPGVQAPVYVVTSLSSPPWVPLELSVSDEKTPSGDLIFARTFEDVAEGSYQYKIRIGEGHWVVDESQDSATDGSGNRNNVINVAPDAKSPSTVSPTVVSTEGRQDSVQGTTSNHQASVPTPFVVVEKVADKNRPDYGDIEASTLDEDATKRTADAEPDFESILPETPSSTHRKETDAPPVPIVVVEKTDDGPAHGDDFGKHATSAQKLAHELRAADASPDKVIVSPEPEAVGDHSIQADMLDTEPLGAEVDKQTTPLFPHETVAPRQDPHVEQEAPLLHHEVPQPDLPENILVDPIRPIVGAQPSPQEQDAPLFHHETSHSETGAMGSIEEESVQSSTDQEGSHADLHTPSDISDEGEVQFEAINRNLDELDNDPLVPQDQTAASDDDEADYDDNDGAASDDECPLLPHERNSNDPSSGNSEVEESTFPGTKDVFLNRTSSLPHMIPPSDEEDDDLHDPSLEEFPTERGLILERVATISSQLPADETRDFPHSPEFAVLSQACSSVDLAPSTSHTSLRPVAEEALLESESETDDGLCISDTQSKAPADSSEVSGAGVHNASESTHVEGETSRSQSASEAESVQKVDGAKESSVDPGKVYDAIATPAKILNPLTPPLTPERNISSLPRLSAGSGSTPKKSQDSEDSSLKPLADISPTLATSQEPPSPKKDNPLRSFLRFLTSCFGGPKQTSGAFLIVGFAIASYYYLYGF